MPGYGKRAVIVAMHRGVDFAAFAEVAGCSFQIIFESPMTRGIL